MSHCAFASKHHFDHGVTGQGKVELVQLFSGGGVDHEGDSQIFTSTALSHLNGGGVKEGVMRFGDLAQCVHKMICFGAHDLDGENAGVLDERRARIALVQNGGGGWGCFGCHHEWYLKGTIPKYKGHGVIIAWGAQEKFTTADSSLGFSLTMVSFTKFHGPKAWASNWPATKRLRVCLGSVLVVEKDQKWALIDR